MSTSATDESKLGWVSVLMALAFLCSACFASSSYVVTNNDNLNGNSATIYSLDESTGQLTLLMDLPTGGFGSNGGFDATVGTGAAMTETGGCLLVYDTGSSDIASFRVDLKTMDVTRVGNFSNSALLSGYPGGSLAVTPNGKFLYATYASSENIGSWAVNSDCSLSFVAAYTASAGADSYDGVKVTPNGQNVLVTAPDIAAAEMFAINQATGELNDLGFADFGSLAECAANGCYPAGIDITADSKEAVIGNSSLSAASVLAAAITTGGLKDATYFNLANTGDLSNNDNVPFLSAAAYHGSGPIYFGMSGVGPGTQPGVATGNFSELEKNITGKTATAIKSPNDQDGLIAATSNLMVVSEWFNTLQVFTINADGTLTPTAQGPVSNNNAKGAYSFFIFPDTR
jgi:hypothetical protein